MDADHQDTVNHNSTTIGNVEWVLSRKSDLLIPQYKKQRRTVPFDWLNLIGVLLIPFVVTVIGLYATQQITQQQAQASEKQHQIDLQIAADQQQETSLETYISNIQDLLLNYHLHDSKQGDEIRAVARGRTLEVLSRINTTRKSELLQFLYESDLIGSVSLDQKGDAVVSSAVINLADADLQHVDLSNADLSGANLDLTELDYANLSNADLYKASFVSAEMIGANLSSALVREANFTTAELLGANFRGVIFYKTKLLGADLTDATLPDGSVYHP